MHPVKILSDPLRSVEKSLPKRESVVINLGDPNGETNPQQLSIMLFARTAEIDRVRSIHRTALLSPPLSSALSVSFGSADRWPLSTQACTNYSCLVGADEWR